MIVSMYALYGETNAEVKLERTDVHCLRASLSEHDLDPVARLSALPISRFSIVWRTLLLKQMPCRETSSHLAFV